MRPAYRRSKRVRSFPYRPRPAPMGSVAVVAAPVGATRTIAGVSAPVGPPCSVAGISAAPVVGVGIRITAAVAAIAITVAVRITAAVVIWRGRYRRAQRQTAGYGSWPPPSASPSAAPAPTAAPTPTHIGDEAG